MPILPLYNPDAPPDAWHEVRAPGGYESWYFDAEDPSGDRLIVVIFSQGFTHAPMYLRRYARYRRHPTRITPPVPEEFPNLYVAYYEGGEQVHQSSTIFPLE